MEVEEGLVWLHRHFQFELVEEEPHEPDGEEVVRRDFGPSVVQLEKMAAVDDLEEWMEEDGQQPLD